MAEHELNKIVDDDGEVFNLRDSTNQPVADRVTAWGSTPSDTKYPSEKLVKDSLDGKQDDLGISTSGDAGKFLNEQGDWAAPAVVKSLQYWSGGSTSIKGVYIGTCKLKNGWNAWITGAMSATNYYDSDPNVINNKGLAIGGFYLWAYRSGSSLTAKCRFYSMNARSTNTDFFLVYKKDTSDSTTYKVDFYVAFGPKTEGGGTATQARPFGLGINYLENHNADIPDRLTGITDDIPYDDYHSVFKFPFLKQDLAGLGSNTKPVFVSSDGSFAACNEMLLKSGSNATSGCADALLSALPDNWTGTPTDTTKLIRRDTNGVASFGQVTFLTVWNYIKTKIHNGSLGSAIRPVYWNGSNLDLSKPSQNVNLMGNVGKDTASKARADTTALENTTINCNNSAYHYLNAMKFIENVPYTFLIPSVNSNKSGLVTSTKLDVYPIGAAKYELGTNATLYLDHAGGSSTNHEIVFAYRVGTVLYIFHQY